MNDSIFWLKRAIPYIRRYKNQTFVIKVGGSLLADENASSHLAEQVALLSDLSIRIIVVHGGGPQATALTKKLGQEPQIIAGRRITNDDALEVMKMTLAGQCNLDLVSAFTKLSLKAVGLTGLDSGLICAHKRPPVDITDDDGKMQTVDFGNVGDIDQVNPEVLDTLLDDGFLPVIASMAGDKNGRPLNINADTVAEAIAVALKAKKLIFLTDAPGVLRDKDDATTLVPFADKEDIDALVANGSIAAGMRPKVAACLSACESGVKRTHIIGGFAENALLLEVLTGEGCGTMIVAEREKQQYQETELG